MKLIVDGPDGGGKSRVIERLGMDRIHLKSLRGGVGGTTLAGWAGADDAPVAYARQLREAPDNTAFDRFYLSELLYGPMLRGESAITDEEVTLVKRVERAMQIPTLVCLPSYATTLQNVMQDGRERPVYQTPKFLRESYQGWQRLAAQHRPQLFDYEQDTLPDAWLTGQPLPGAMIGSPTADTLIVTTDHLYLPAFSMKDTSATRLNRALWYSGWNEESLAFTNAHHWAHNQKGVKAALLSTITTVIAVGLEAYESLTIAKVGNQFHRQPFVFLISDPATVKLPVLTEDLRSIRSMLNAQYGSV